MFNCCWFYRKYFLSTRENTRFTKSAIFDDDNMGGNFFVYGS